jgi:hypothetical protein
MAYCSYCAAVLDPTQNVCSRCGRPLPTAAPAVVEGRPSSVRLAGILLLISCVISLLSLAGTLLTSGMVFRMPAQFLVRPIAFGILWIVLTILVWQRQGWARIAILLILAWSIANLLISMLRIGGALTLAFSLAFALLVDALRAGAAYLLFKPDSNTWYKK